MNIQELSDKHVKLQDMHIELQKEYLEMLTFITDKIIISKAEFELIKQTVKEISTDMQDSEKSVSDLARRFNAHLAQSGILKLLDILAQVEGAEKGKEKESPLHIVKDPNDKSAKVSLEDMFPNMKP